MFWIILYFVISIIFSFLYFISNHNRKKRVAHIIGIEKNNLEKIITNSTSKLMAIKSIKSSYKLDTMTAIEVYLKVV